MFPFCCFFQVILVCFLCPISTCSNHVIHARSAIVIAAQSWTQGPGWGRELVHRDKGSPLCFRKWATFTVVFRPKCSVCSFSDNHTVWKMLSSTPCLSVSWVKRSLCPSVCLPLPIIYWVTKLRDLQKCQGDCDKVISKSTWSEQCGWITYLLALQKSHQNLQILPVLVGLSIWGSPYHEGVLF